jgi:hypothetical protein
MRVPDLPHPEQEEDEGAQCDEEAEVKSEEAAEMLARQLTTRITIPRATLPTYI